MTPIHELIAEMRRRADEARQAFHVTVFVDSDDLRRLCDAAEKLWWLSATDIHRLCDESDSLTFELRDARAELAALKLALRIAARFQPKGTPDGKEKTQA